MHPAITITTPAPARPQAGVRVVAGLAAGMTVLTLDGEIPVEHLMPGDRLITRGSGIATLAALATYETGVALVRFRAQSLGHGRPEGEALLGPDTKVLIRDWRAGALWGQPSAMVPASRLADGCYIRTETPRTVRLFLPRLTAPAVIYAGGLEIGLA
ncbi:MAG: Hint domain-containing protein [Rubellimicrobium sp.]|nr:Hint domain-containing protein [Rubellimicrobium sp.]